MQQDVWIIQVAKHFLGVGYEVRRQVTAVELHAFNNVQRRFQRLGFFNSDDAFVADTLHGFCDALTDFSFAVGGDRSNLGNFVGSL